MKMTVARWVFGGIPLSVALWVCSLPANGQTRAEEIQKERAEKARGLHAEVLTRTENVMREAKDDHWMEKLQTGFYGFTPQFGNMVTGSGFAAGLAWKDTGLFKGLMTARFAAQVSTRLYERYEADLTMPRLLDGKLSLGLQALRRNYSSLQYYGPGPDSARTGRSNYRLEDNLLQFSAGATPHRHIKVGGGISNLWVNVGPGKDSRFVSSEKIYSPQQAVGIDQQTSFLRPGVFFQYDYRDNPLGPKVGGNYVFEYTWFHDNRYGLYGFRRMDIDLQQYVGIFNRTRRIALRAKTTLTESDGSQEIPFYLQPQVGGSDDLRGFRPFRFTDRNSLVMNAEYRWEIASGIDGAVFVDGGKVFHHRGQLNFKDLEGSAGFGLRFNARNSTFLRVDVGFSHEGFGVWLKFNDVFSPRIFGTGVSQPLY